MEMCSLQWCPFRHGTANPQVHVWHVHSHSTFVYMVCGRHWPLTKAVKYRIRFFCSSSLHILQELLYAFSRVGRRRDMVRI